MRQVTQTTESKAVVNAGYAELDARLARLDIHALIAQLESKNPAQRESAIEALRVSGADGFEAILSAIVDENEKRRTKGRRLRISSVLLTTSMTALLVYLRFVAGFTSIGRADVFFLVWILLVGFSGLTAMVTSRHGRLARVIGYFDDERAIGPLVDLLNSPDKALVAEIQNTLARLLPNATSAEASWLDSSRLKRLCGLLYHKDQNIVLAVLSAIERFGGAECLLSVQRAQRKYAASKPESDVSEAVNRCVVSLTDRIQKTSTSRALLRPTQAPSGAGLLRPAGMGKTPDSQVLLKPVDGDG